MGAKGSSIIENNNKNNISANTVQRNEKLTNYNKEDESILKKRNEIHLDSIFYVFIHLIRLHS